jgi:hypothetical protein
MGKVEVEIKELQPPELRDLLANERRCTVVYDIETGPADEETVRRFFKEDKVKRPAHPGEFDPHKVKYGNTKDAAKRRAKLEDEMAKHRLALANYVSDCEKAVQEAWKDFYDRAALDPTTGRVLAIGYGVVRPDGIWYCMDLAGSDERNLIRRHWLFVESLRKRAGKLVSFNGHRFDYPFLRRRSWAYADVKPPNLVTKYRKMEDFCIDALEEYRTGGSWSENISLDDLGMMLGLGGKTEGMTGALFYQVLKDDAGKALDYLARDVELTYLVAQRMELI